MATLVLIAFLTSIFFGYMVIPNILVISKRKRLFDSVNSRKIHTALISRLGGISFMPGILFSFFLTVGIGSVFYPYFTTPFDKAVLTEFSLVITGMIIIFLYGITDDLVSLDYKRKFAAQIVATSLIVCSGVYLKDFHGLLGLYEIPSFVGIPLTIFIMVGIINSYNLIDGMDGLCSGLALIVLTCLVLWFWYYGFYFYAMFGVSAIGTLGVFFLYNVGSMKKKLFMGDCGSLTLGYMISFLGFKYINLSNIVASPTDVCAPLVLFSMVFVPLFDCFRVFIQRIINKKSPFTADKTHIHHLFLNMGFKHIECTGMILICSLLIIILNLLSLGLNPNILLIINIILGIVVLYILPKKIANIINKKEKEPIVKTYKNGIYGRNNRIFY